MTIARSVRSEALTGARLRPLTPLLAVLLGPDLGGRAACKGLAPLHDDEVPGETAEEREARLYRAAAVCARCDVVAACAAARVELHRKAVGVWAGQLAAGPR